MCLGHTVLLLTKWQFAADEIAANGMPFGDLQRYINLVRGILDEFAPERHGSLEPMILYYCTSTYASLWPHIPRNLTHLALDDYSPKWMYGYNLWVKGAYEKYIFPRLYPGLKLLVVPPTWGANESCREKPSVWCTNQTYGEWVQLNLGNFSFYTNWVFSEPRIVGFDPFLLHGYGEVQKGAMQLGMLQMPEVKRPYMSLGKAIQQNAKNQNARSPTIERSDPAQALAPVRNCSSYIANVKEDFGAVGDGVIDDLPHIQAAVDSVAANCDGGFVYVPPGVYLIGGENYLEIRPRVTLRGAGPATRIVSGSGGAARDHVLLYIRDSAAVEDCRLSGSDFISKRSKNGTSGAAIAHNKIGVMALGLTGHDFLIRNVGFEKFLNSHVFVSTNHSNALIDACYTFGTQVGHFAAIDVASRVSAWSIAPDAAEQAAGRQAYCLTNFYNSGDATTDVKITNGRHSNINDAFVGINGRSSRHIILGNSFIKAGDGYVGGWGVDLATGTEGVVSDNIITGASAGIHLSGSTKCTVSGNRIDAVIGIWLDSAYWTDKAHTVYTSFTPSANTISSNTISCSFCDRSGGVADSFNSSTSVGILFSGAVANVAMGNTIDGHSMASSVGVQFKDSTNVPSNTAPVAAVENLVANNVFFQLGTGVRSGGNNSISGNVVSQHQTVKSDDHLARPVSRTFGLSTRFRQPDLLNARARASDCHACTATGVMPSARLRHKSSTAVSNLKNDDNDLLHNEPDWNSDNMIFLNSLNKESIAVTWFPLSDIGERPASKTDDDAVGSTTHLSVLSFYGDDPKGQRGISNWRMVGGDVLGEDIQRHYDESGMRAFLDIQAGGQLWATDCGNYPTYRFNASTCGTKPGWRHVIRAMLSARAPQLASHALSGIFLGGEWRGSLMLCHIS
jgi:parallel beta-helix repeat protein